MTIEEQVAQNYTAEGCPENEVCRYGSKDVDGILRTGMICVDPNESNGGDGGGDGGDGGSGGTPEPPVPILPGPAPSPSEF